ncbi:peptidylprolyl isomerase [Peribacillus simplex]|uniref:peptidylprolyl isomerase n=1 Tax=Peribacillus simplex TaxID=1478 RepID=UPI003D26BCC5
MKLLRSPKAYVWAGGLFIIAGILVFATISSTDETMASVDGDKIKKDELYDALVAVHGTDTLNKLIDDKLIKLEADKEGINITDAEIQKEMDILAETSGGEKALMQKLEASGVSIAALKKELVVHLQTKKLIEPRSTVTDDEINTYFKENQNSFAQGEQVEASHILVENEKTAKKVAKKIAKGGVFTKLAAEYSTDTGTAKKGGSLGYFSKGDMVKEFEDVAFELDIDQVSDPVKSKYGYHIIKVTGKKEAKKANFEDSKKEVKAELLSEKSKEVYSKWLAEVKEKHEITNKLEGTK